MSADGVPDGVSDDQVNKAQKKAWELMEGQLLSWVDSLRADIKGRLNSTWRDRDAAEATARKIEEAGKEEQAIEDAILDINGDLRRLLALYAIQHQDPSRGTAEIGDQIHAFLRTLHNPETREVLLLAVKEEYRDDIRDWFREIGMASWGVIDLAEGNTTDEFWFIASQLADMQDIEVADLVTQMDGVTAEDIPEEVL